MTLKHRQFLAAATTAAAAPSNTDAARVARCALPLSGRLEQVQVSERSS